MGRPAGGVAYLWAGIVLTLATLVIYVLLRADQNSMAPIMLFVVPIITGLFTAAKVEAATASQNDTLDAQNVTLDAHGQTLFKIQQQTNGVLDQRIRDGVTAALAARDAAATAALVANQSPALPTPNP